MRRLLHSTVITVLFLAISLPSPAQATPQRPRREAQATQAREDSTPRVLTVDEYGRWKRVTSTELSHDGAWMTYAYAPNDGDDTLFVKDLDGDRIYTIPRGAEPSFSDDARWVGYFVSPPQSNGRSNRGGPGATPPGGRGERGGANGTPRRFELRNLATGETWEAPNARAFTFANGSGYVAVHLNKTARSDTTHGGTDLLVRTLSGGTTRNIGNVGQYAFDDAGRLLAYTIDAAEDLGNGVYLVDLASGATRALDTGPRDFDGLAWSDEGTNLAVLRGTKADSLKQRDNVLLTWTGLTDRGGRETTWDPSGATDFPDGYVLSEYATPRWSPDGSKVFVGIKQQEKELPDSAESKADVDVWHWKDAEVQSVQKVRLQRELRSTFTSTVLIPSGRFVQLADSAMPTVDVVVDGTWGVGRNDTTYRGEVSWGGSHADFYRVNTATGERTLIANKLMRTMGTSPDSKRFLYLQDGHVYAYEAATGKSTQVDGGMNFVNTDDDHDYEKPIWGLAGWSRDGRSVLVYDKYDVWKLPLSGTDRPENLTRGVGKAQEVRLRVVRLDLERSGGFRGRFFGFGGGPDPDDHGIDLSKPLTLSAYGEWTKKSGYWTLPPGQEPSPLMYEDKAIGQLTKAKNADRVIFTEQTFREFPDVWTSTTSFRSPEKVTDANPFIDEYRWGSKAPLIDYTNSKGQHLQATLTLPAGYEPGKRYPMIVYFYEIVSDTHHRFSMPRFDDRPQMSTYA
ncbi:MAG: hypothetical protein PVJ02_15685, partial [Gemmatimonadota bacterium]